MLSSDALNDDARATLVEALRKNKNRTVPLKRSTPRPIHAETRALTTGMKNASLSAVDDPLLSLELDPMRVPVLDPPENHIFMKPRREILLREDLVSFTAHPTRLQLLSFIRLLAESIVNIPVSCKDIYVSPLVESIVQVLDQLQTHIANISLDEAIPNKANNRYGHPAFRQWIDWTQSQMDTLMTPIVASAQARMELNVYFLSSFGSRQRIDYGTGHEAHFLAWLYCLCRLGLVTEKDYAALVLRVFDRYIALMRALQWTFWLEPAGSQGVWGLDDYAFLPFLFGAAQLMKHPYLRPRSIHDAEVVESFSQDYLYFGCIAFVNRVKTASLRWHSPMLDDISGLRTWQQVYRGLVKMYAGDVLAKVPIMQHFLFGSLIPFMAASHRLTPVEGEETMTARELLDRQGFAYEDNGQDECDRLHRIAGELPSCCSNVRVPAAIAVKAQESLRPLPFD